MRKEAWQTVVDALIWGAILGWAIYEALLAASAPGAGALLP